MNELISDMFIIVGRNVSVLDHRKFVFVYSEIGEAAADEIDQVCYIY